jgi:phosphate transport system substrate-binding protein
VRLIAALVAGALVLAGCGGGGGGSSSGSDGGALVGAGSTFVFPLVAKWIPDYSKSHDVTITYGPIGSGGGIQQITNRTVDFGASDAPLSPDQQTACKGCFQVPWALAGTSIPYNVPDAPKHLKLTGSILAAMFLGTIKSWNDPAITRLNPGVKLPQLAVTPIYRTDSSGTTYNFTDYLSHVSPEWKSKVGTGTSVNFPTGAGGKGSSGVAAALSRAEGGITYIDAAYSIENGFAYAALQNKAGTFVLPDRAAVAAAAATITSVPPDNAVSIVDPPASAAQAYPLSTFTYAIVPEKSGKADLLKPFLTYAIGPGQAFAAELQFAQLPASILAADRSTIAKITTG